MSITAKKIRYSNSQPSSQEKALVVRGEHFNAVIDDLEDHETRLADLEDGTITTDTVSVGNGTVSLPSVTFTSDTNTGMYRIGSDNIGFAVGGAKKIDIAATGVTFSGGTTSQVTATVASAQSGITVSGTTSGYGIDVTAACGEGIRISGNATIGLDLENGTFATGIRVSGTITNGLIIGACGTNGISLTGVCGTGISMIGGNATGINISGTYSTASSKAITSKITINAANLGDGVGTNEFELTITGTSTSTAASSSWVNIITGTATGLVCAQTNGVYEEATGTISGATIIFGMRMQSLCADAPGESYPFSCVSNTNIITALFSCNAGSSDMGTITDAGVDATKLVPLYKETSTGTTYYVKIYTHS